jgi:RimJ/RimL family protein N-acetyltransferase
MWPRAEPIRTQRLTLEPLTVAHAAEMVPVLASRDLYAWTGGGPPTEGELASRYEAQSAGQSMDGTSGWLNWVVRRSETGVAAGYVQATVTRTDDALVADVAWVTGVDQQGDGVATEAAGAMLSWLAGQGVVTVDAFIHPGNLPSAAVAQRLGLARTSTVVDGEVCWSGKAKGPG